MSYISDNLLKDETIKYWARPHWVIFITPGLIFILAFLAISYGSALPISTLNIFARPLHQWVSLILFFLAIASTLNAYVLNISSEFAVTNKRVMMKAGLLQRKTLEIFLSKIEAIDVQQTIPGRLLDYGSLLVAGTGGTRAEFHCIPAPLKFRRIAQQQIDHELSR